MKHKRSVFSIILILTILISGMGFYYESAQSLFSYAHITKNTPVIVKDISSDINKEATIEESMVYRLTSYITNDNKRNHKNSRLVSILYCVNNFSQNTNFYITSLSKNYNIVPINDVIINFIQQQDGKK